MREHPITTDDGGFDRTVLQADVPVLVDFWAPWCGPCHMVAPVVEQLAGEYAGQLRTVKVNVDECPVVSRRYGIQSIPTLSLFRQGKEVKRFAGVRPKSELAGAINQILAAKPNVITAAS
jgi:thioredoxin 1